MDCKDGGTNWVTRDCQAEIEETACAGDIAVLTLGLPRGRRSLVLVAGRLKGRRVPSVIRTDGSSYLEK